MTLPEAPAAPGETETTSGFSKIPAVALTAFSARVPDAEIQSEIPFKNTPPPPLPPREYTAPDTEAEMDSFRTSGGTAPRKRPSTTEWTPPASDSLSAATFQEFALPRPSLEFPEMFNELSGITRYTEATRRGPFTYALSLNTAVVYDDNVSLSNTAKRRALLLGIGPSAKILFGSDESAMRLGANYAGTASSYSDRPRERAYDQNVRIAANWSGARMRLAISTGMQSSHNSSLDVGDTVGRKVYSAGGTASYEFTGKTSADVGADLAKTDFGPLLSSTEYRTQEFLNYQWSPKLQWGAGATQGITDAENTARQTYLQGLLRVLAKLTSKIGINASAGNEWRHYDSGQPASTSPVFGVAAVWQATGKTTINVDARRRTFASAALVSQNYESTSTNISAHEMLGPNLGASLSVGMERAHYSASSPGVQADREDNYLFSRIALEWLLGRRCNLGTFYEAGNNNSSGSQAQSFRRNRVGVSLSFSF